jgi:hypothetical protein
MDVFYKSLCPDQLLSVINAPVAHLDRASAFDIGHLIVFEIGAFMGKQNP